MAWFKMTYAAAQRGAAYAIEMIRERDELADVHALVTRRLRCRL